MGANGLQAHIQANNVRATVLLAGFPLLLLGIVYAFTFAMIGGGYLPTTGDVAGDAGRMMLAAAPLALIVTGVWFAIAWFANTAIIGAVTGARPVSREEAPDLHAMLERLCAVRGMSVPHLHIIDTPALNAFASGVHEGQYTVTFTTGILQRLNRDEIEAVMAHELTHIVSRDVRTMIIASVFAGIITLLAQVLVQMLMFGGGRDGERRGGLFMIIAIAAGAIGYLLAIVIRMALSRTREFVADAGAAQMTGRPDAMISALRKISGNADMPAPESVRGMFIENASAAMGLFSTHPPIEARIEALARHGGGGGRPAPAAQPASGPWSRGGTAVPVSRGDRGSGPWG